MPDRLVRGRVALVAGARVNSQRYGESGEERCALLTETRHHGLALHGMLLSLFHFRPLIGKSTTRVDRSPHPSSRTRAIDHENAERMGRWGFWGRASARLVVSHVTLHGGYMAVPWRTWWSRMSRRLFSSGVSVCVEFGRGLAARRWWWWARRCIVGPRGGHSLALVVVFFPNEISRAMMGGDAHSSFSARARAAGDEARHRSLDNRSIGEH